VPRRERRLRRLATASRWPVGVALTSWRYMWRITPVHRWEMTGGLPGDAPPPAPGIRRPDLQPPEAGVGPLVHRLYRTRIAAARLEPEQLMSEIGADLDRIAPSEFASFRKLDGVPDRLAPGDELVVRMPGPWDGPVTVVDVTPTSFRLATLAGHLEAGQIEFRTRAGHRSLHFSIESWARSGDRLSDLLYTHARMSKEIQLHMWTSVLERVAKVAQGTIEGGISVVTKRVEDPGDELTGGLGPGRARDRRRLAALAAREINFEPAERPTRDRPGRWRLDDLVEPLPHEPSGPPVEGGSWQVARELMLAYQVADPAVVRATYRRDAPLEGRDMLLGVRFAGLHFHVGVRVGSVYDEIRRTGGREARVFGWGYRTLEGHFEEGQMHYEVWKWLDTGDVEFRLHAFSRPARSGPALPRIGFRLVGRGEQLRFYHKVCRRVRRLTEAELEVREEAVRA
jgi:uncharacterized protein (UPF0548 family)